MPICPRCGNVLTSDQALTYHLNKKFRCGSWQCIKCSTTCSTKLKLQVHEMTCLSSKTSPSMMDIVYNEGRIAIIELNDEHIITAASPQSTGVLGMNQLEGKSVNDICNINTNRKMQMLTSNIALFY